MPPEEGPTLLWELIHPSHLRMKGFLAELPTLRGGHTMKINRRKVRGKASCSHCCAFCPDLLLAMEREPGSLLVPAILHQTTATQQASSNPGEQADNWRGFNSISP